MTCEDFYHSRPMTFLQRLVSVGYGTCRCCGMPWNFVRGHGGEHTIMIDKYEGFFPVCEYCWTRKSYEQNKRAVTELIKTWEEQGARHYDPHYNPDIYITAFEDDWFKTHNNEKI